MDRTRIETYEAGAATLRRAVQDLTPEQLDARPDPGAGAGTWTIRELIWHLVDSDLTSAVRMKLIISHDTPRLYAYDENRFTARLGYQRMEVPIALEAFAANRRAVAHMLRGLPDEAFARQGDHEESGPITLAKMAELYIWHVEHHLDFVRRKLALQSAAVAGA